MGYMNTNIGDTSTEQLIKNVTKIIKDANDGKITLEERMNRQLKEINMLKQRHQTASITTRLDYMLREYNLVRILL